jgi:DNA polymerase-3 subunit epsilon/ATP-dependent DNA helicase DinG
VPRTFVALDLETTGLEARRDAIIEVAAVKFRDGEPVDHFATLVDPGRPIPYEITVLTGITDRDVIGKPRFAQVADHLTRFVGELPVVGHNIGFDLGFLDIQGVLAGNKAFDTWELATILLPSLPSYGLAALATQFGLETANAHRALADAHMTGQLFLRLCAEVARLPLPLLLEINRLAQGSDWPLAQVFAEALMSAGVPRVPSQEIPLEQLAPGCPLFQPWRAPDPLNPRESPQPIEVEELAAMLKPGGTLSRAFPGYEYRPPQVAMLRAVAEAFNQSHHLMVEAGTGTGKSLAYLLPAIAFAVKNNTRVVVSTNTINLQDQLFKKDLPDLQRVLAEAWGREVPFRAALLKGRGNYLCPRRFMALKSRASLSADELRGIARILVWLPRTQTGDQSELSLPRPSDRAFWGQVSADNEGCTLDRCQREMKGRCFFYRARKQAEAAHIVVVNHALLMADAATDNRVLPEYHHLIIDEAHHLEDAVTDQLSFKADAYTLSQLFAALYSSGVPVETRRGRRSAVARTATSIGLLAEILAWAHARAPAEQAQLLSNLIYGLQADVAAVNARLQDFWQVMEEALRDMTPPSDNDEYGLRLRITSVVRNQPIWVDVEVSWENLAATWQALLQHLEPLGQLLRDLLDVVEKPEVLESLAEELGSTILRLLAFYEQMEAWVMQPDPNSVYWVEASAGERQAQHLTLRAAPLHIGPLVQQHIFFRNDTVVMTSATLRTGGSFDYLRGRLCADEADTATVGSPFDYKASTLLYLPTDLPEPTEPGYQKAVEQALIGLARALGGRTLALFTSHNQLRRTARAIAPALAEAGITVLSQSSGTSRHQLLEAFKTTERTILLGTRSFWEGVDVVGPALSALVLVRLPFAVPSDPVVAARAETFDDPFYNYSVPDAILRFRQGFGRLIRSKSDRGVVVVLDRRIQSKLYGQLFLESLPECTVHRGPLMNLPAAAQRWLATGSGGFDSADGTHYDAPATSEASQTRRF